MSAVADRYVVTVTREARQIIRELERDEQQQLADWLSTELTDEPTIGTVVIGQGLPHPLPTGRDYFAQAVLGYVAIFRRMTDGELDRLAAERGLRGSRRPSKGFLVFDLVPAVPE